MLAQFSIARPVFTIVLSLLIVLLGLLGLAQLGVREYPSVDPPTISISTMRISWMPFAAFTRSILRAPASSHLIQVNTAGRNRERNVSWAKIGEALGVSRQAAWERFS